MCLSILIMVLLNIEKVHKTLNTSQGGSKGRVFIPVAIKMKGMTDVSLCTVLFLFRGPLHNNI